MTVTMPSEEEMNFWQNRKTIRLELQQAIQQTRNLFNTRNADTIGRFLGVIEPTSVYDLGRLPYHSRNKGHASHPTKPCCVFALIAEAILRYWQFVQTKDPGLINNITQAIDVLRDVTEHYDDYDVMGNPARGYCMLLPDLKIKYEQCELCGRSPLGVPIGDKTCKECLSGESENIEKPAENGEAETDEGSDIPGVEENTEE